MFITLDFETYYDKDYTLRKLSTSEYIRNKQFEAISCSIKIDKRKPFCSFGEDIRTALSKIDWANVILLCHNTQFDGLILTHHYGHIPKRYADTLAMARALHPKAERNDLATVAQHYNCVNKLEMPDFKGIHLKDITKDLKKKIIAYNNGDVQSTYEVYQKMIKDYPVTELDLIDITIRMFTEPVLRVDLKKAKIELKREQDAKEVAIKASGQDIDTLSSNPKFCAALTALGVTVPTKPSPTIPGKEIPAVAKSDEALQSFLLHPDPKVVALVEGRFAAKSTIGESRAARLIMSGSGGLRLPIYLNYAMAHTLRWSGGDKCLSGDTRIYVLRSGQILCIMLSLLENDDLVWDGESFVIHDGLVCQGITGVIDYDGITGTEDHKVFVEGKEEAITLGEARKSNYVLKSWNKVPGLETPAKTMPSIKR